MSKDNKVIVIFIFCLKTYKYWRSQNTYHLSTLLYNQIYFDRRVQFHPSIRSGLYLVRQFWSEKLIFMRIQCLLRHPRFIEVR